MKKSFLKLGLFFCCYIFHLQSPIAQIIWSTDTLNIWNTVLSKKVGIGIDKPHTTLDVNGNLTLSKGRSVIFTTGDDPIKHKGGIQFLTSSNGLNNVWTPTNENGVPVNSAITFGGFGSFNSNIVDIGISGNLAIGTNNIQNKLYIAGPHFNMYTGCDLAGGGFTKNSLTIEGNPQAGYSTLKITSGHLWNNDRGLLSVDRQGNNYFYVRMDGNVGIGTTNPLGKLHVTDNNLNIYTSQGVSSGWTKNGLTIMSNSDAGYSTLRVTSDHSAITDRALLNVDRSGNSYMYVRMDGNVGIGTTNPTQKLSVNGTIQAKEILVNTGWSDFVFDDNYKLRSLTEVEQFVKANKHLPEIPSQQQVDKNGVQLGDISSKLLMKIEELTLYMIEMKKENETMKNRIELLEKENTLLKTSITKN